MLSCELHVTLMVLLKGACVAALSAVEKYLCCNCMQLTTICALMFLEPQNSQIPTRAAVFCSQLRSLLIDVHTRKAMHLVHL